jgi:hypothetical protein
VREVVPVFRPAPQWGAFELSLSQSPMTTIA